MTENQQPLTQDQKVELALENLRKRGWILWRNNIAFPSAAYVEMAEFFYSNQCLHFSQLTIVKLHKNIVNNCWKLW